MLLAACDRQEPAVALDKGEVVAVGIDGAVLRDLDHRPDAAFTRVLSVSVGPGLPPLAGRYRTEGRTLRFIPAFPLEGGRIYDARLDPGGGRPVVAVRLATHALPSESGRVVAVFPSGDAVPQNLLRLYVQFSAPMAAGRQGALQMLDDQGRPLDDPFLPLGYEFWSPDRTRLTLLLDPGRVKRGILPGPVLQAGRRYTLVVGGGWTDAGGRAVAPFRRSYAAGPPERRALDTATWRIAAPRAGTRDPVKVNFGRPLDVALLRSAMGMEDAAGAQVSGRVDSGPDERSWRFTPERPWAEGTSWLIVQPWLEDPSGNRPGRPFEQVSRAAAAKTPIRLPVTLAP
jgi:hypothetical protein